MIKDEHKNSHKCKRVARGQDRVEVIRMTDLVLVKNDILPYM